jgi:N utilization substance protein A
VGLKGSRVQAVVSELSGERIDIVPWHPDPEIFARRALAPAKVAKVISDSSRHVITAVVDEDQLSLAIGRNGQNVRLASQLIGWQIDLYASRDWLARGAETTLFGGDEFDAANFPLSELEGVAPATLAALQAAGINTFFDVLDMERDDFLHVPGIGEEEADALVALIEELTVEEAGAVGEPAAAEENSSPAIEATEEPQSVDEVGQAEEEPAPDVVSVATEPEESEPSGPESPAE